MFLGIIALEEAKVVVDHPATVVTLGDLRNPEAVLMLLGFVLIAALNFRRVLGATLIGILVAAIIGLPFGLAKFTGVVSMPPSILPIIPVSFRCHLQLSRPFFSSTFPEYSKARF